MEQDFSRIPQEMRVFHQWNCWRYEERESSKPTKVPYDPRTGNMASVIAPETWCSFEEVVAAATAPGTSYDGIGFVLTKDDPYVIIDLDHTTKQVDLDRQVKVFNEMNSYSERSPSGQGLHIITKAHIPQGRRRSSIEMYATERYMTMTGNVYLDQPIRECQELVHLLWAQMGSGAGAVMYSDEDQPETHTDEQIIEKALAAANGLKFRELLEGRWQGLYTSQSEADFAFINIIAFYTLNKAQIMRIFWASPLGQRDKAKRIDYVMRMIYRAYDRLLPPIDFIELQQNNKNAVADYETRPAKPDTVLGIDLKPLTPPPGLLGEIAQFIYQSSPRPVEEIALAGAIGLMAGICGRAFNISGTGLNQYILLLAPTGTGKEAINRGISKLMNAVVTASPTRAGVPAATCFIGPAEIASGQALLKHLSDPNKRCFVSVVGEFGLKMQQLASPRASTSEIMLKKVLLDLYNKSGASDVLGGSAYAQKENNTDAINSPAVTIVGESTPSTFYSAIDERLITDGLLPRFTFIEYTGPRPALNKLHETVEPSADLVQRLAQLAGHCIDLMHRNIAHKIGCTPEATQFFDIIELETTALINATQSDAIRDLWNRTHIKTMKLAALVAVGVDPYFPCITLEMAQWAFNIIGHDIRNITKRFVRGEVGRDTSQLNQVNELVRIIKEYLTRSYEELKKYGVRQDMHTDKTVVPRAYISRRLSGISAFKNDPKGGSEAIARAEKILVEDGDLVEARAIECDKYKFKGKAFVIVNPARFLDE